MNEQNNVLAFLPKPLSLTSKLECIKCGASVDSACNCGVKYVPAWKRATEAVVESPEKSDRMIAEAIGVSRMTVKRARAGGTNVTPDKRVGKDGKTYRSFHGLTLIDGYSCITDAALAGIEIERSGSSVTEAFAKSGLGLHAYRIVRDAILLSQRNDLSTKDQNIVRNALAEINAKRSVKHAITTIRPIADKVWGQGNRFKPEGKRLESFLSSISGVVAACVATSEIPIPHISAEQRDAALRDLKEAGQALILLGRRIKQGS